MRVIPYPKAGTFDEHQTPQLWTNSPLEFDSILSAQVADWQIDQGDCQGGA